MRRALRKTKPAALGVMLALLVIPATFAAPDAEQATRTPAALRLPSSFITNVGQLDSEIELYLLQGANALWIGAGKVTMTTLPARGDLEPDAVTLRFLGASSDVVVEGRGRLPGVVNAYQGRDPSRWVQGAATYAEAAQRDLYPGVTQVYRGVEGRVKSEFRVGPGADPSVIRMVYDDVESVEVAANGDLVLHTAFGEWRESAPVAFQEIGGERVPVEASFRLRGEREVDFALGPYDAARELVIDPVLFFSTFLGGGGSGGAGSDSSRSMAIDAAGNIVVAGITHSTTFPVVSAAQPVKAGPTGSNPVARDFFVAKLNPTGDTLIYATYLGGSNREHTCDVALDPTGNAYLAGWTTSTDFPTTAGVLGPGPFGVGGSRDDAVVVKLDPAGALVYGTYLGGSSDDQPEDIAVDDTGHAYVLGNTISANFPTTAGTYQPTIAGSWDLFVSKLAPDATSLVYSTFVGGTNFEEPGSIALRGGEAYVVGRTRSGNYPVTPGAFDVGYDGTNTAFLTRLDSAGSSLLYSTFLDGTVTARALDVAVDGSGHAYVTGPTDDTNFAGLGPTSGGEDAFVVKLDPAGSSLLYATLLGGSARDQSRGVAVDSMGSAYVVGFTESGDFPIVDPLPGQASLPGLSSAFLTRLTPDGSGTLLSTYLGGSDRDTGFSVALGPSEVPHVAGSTRSLDFPIARAVLGIMSIQESFGGGTEDAFVARIGLSCVQPPSGMVAWYPADETLGRVMADIVGGNDAAYRGNPNPVTGQVDVGLDVTRGHASAPPDPTLDFGAGSFSIDLWVEPFSTGSILGKYDLGHRIGYELWLDSPGGAPYSVVLTLNNDTLRFSCSIPAGMHHLTVVVDRGPQEARCYVDGQLQGSEPIFDTSSIDNARPLLIGRGRLPVSHFSGIVDEIELFGRVLGANEIAAIVSAGAFGKCKE